MATISKNTITADFERLELRLDYEQTMRIAEERNRLHRLHEKQQKRAILVALSLSLSFSVCFALILVQFINI